MGEIVAKRKVGRPREGKVYVNFNLRMDLDMDADIREIVRCKPNKYPSKSNFTIQCLRDRIRDEKKELGII